MASFLGFIYFAMWGCDGVILVGVELPVIIRGFCLTFLYSVGNLVLCSLEILFQSPAFTRYGRAGGC